MHFWPDLFLFLHTFAIFANFAKIECWKWNCCFKCWFAECWLTNFFWLNQKNLMPLNWKNFCESICYDFNWFNIMNRNGFFNNFLFQSMNMNINMLHFCDKSGVIWCECFNCLLIVTLYADLLICWFESNFNILNNRDHHKKFLLVWKMVNNSVFVKKMWLFFVYLFFSQLNFQKIWTHNFENYISCVNRLRNLHRCWLKFFFWNCDFFIKLHKIISCLNQITDDFVGQFYMFFEKIGEIFW